MNRRDNFTFPSPIAMLRFSTDGQRLFVLTTSQTVYVLDSLVSRKHWCEELRAVIRKLTRTSENHLAVTHLGIP
jgi:hypothetical protein